MKKILTLILSIAVLSLLATPAVLAQADTNYGLDNFASGDSGLGTDTELIPMISNIINIVVGVLGVIAVLIILWAGFIWMTAAGDEAKVDKAKGLITAGIVGLIIIFAAYAIAYFVINSIATSTGATAT